MEAIRYLRHPELWRSYDPPVFDLLQSVMDEPGNRRLRLIEDSGIIPGAKYFNDLLGDKAPGRDAYFAAALQVLGGVDLIFFDPDNGIEVTSKARGRVGSAKYIYRDEIARTYQDRHSVLVYQHFPRQDRDAFLRNLKLSLQGICPGASMWLFQTAEVAFLLLVRPEHDGLLPTPAGTPFPLDPLFLPWKQLDG